MEQNAKLAAHETLELHEMVKSAVNEVKVLQQYCQLAQGSQLKSYIIDCTNIKQNQIRDMEQFIKDHGILQ